jgi:hypothetical protein
MKKIIGLMTAWGTEEWIEAAMKQAVTYCDEVLCWVAPHTKEMDKYEDATYQIAKSFDDGKNIRVFNDLPDSRLCHALVKADILNAMLDVSRNYEEGNWVWTLDVDEFYPSDTVVQIFRAIQDEKVERIQMVEKFFYINGKHYLVGDHFRLFKIQQCNLARKRRFFPTQNWLYPNNVVYTIPIYGMFHYSMLLDPWAKIDFWKTQYTNEEAKRRVLEKHLTWIHKIYPFYDLEDEHLWLKKNFELFGIYSPWFNANIKPAEDGRLYVFNEQHPKFVRDLDILAIDDIREKFNFKDKVL